MRLKAPGFLGEEGGAPIRVGTLSLSRIDSPSAAPSRDFDSGFVLAERSLLSFGSLADVPPGARARLNPNNIAARVRTQNLGITFIRTSQGNQTDFCIAAIEEDRRIARYSVAKKRAETNPSDFRLQPDSCLRISQRRCESILVVDACQEQQMSETVRWGMIPHANFVSLFNIRDGD